MIDNIDVLISRRRVGEHECHLRVRGCLLQSPCQPVSSLVWLGAKLLTCCWALRQGRQSVTDYAIAFRSAMAKSGWNSTAHYDAFLQGLRSRPWSRLSCWSVISLLICGDQRVPFPSDLLLCITGAGAGGFGGQTLTCSTKTWLGGCNWTLLL